MPVAALTIAGLLGSCRLWRAAPTEPSWRRRFEIGTEADTSKPTCSQPIAARMPMDSDDRRTQQLLLRSAIADTRARQVTAAAGRQGSVQQTREGLAHRGRVWRNSISCRLRPRVRQWRFPQPGGRLRPNHPIRMRVEVDHFQHPTTTRQVVWMALGRREAGAVKEVGNHVCHLHSGALM